LEPALNSSPASRVPSFVYQPAFVLIVIGLGGFLVDFLVSPISSSGLVLLLLAAAPSLLKLIRGRAAADELPAATQQQAPQGSAVHQAVAERPAAQAPVRKVAAPQPAAVAGMAEATSANRNAPPARTQSPTARIQRLPDAPAARGAAAPTEAGTAPPAPSRPQPQVRGREQGANFPA